MKVLNGQDIARGCDAWNSFVEEKVQNTTLSSDKYSNIPRSECKKLNDIQTTETVRFSTGYEELDRVLGGGIVDGSLILFGGEPGIRKIYVNT